MKKNPKNKNRKKPQKTKKTTQQKKPKTPNKKTSLYSKLQHLDITFSQEKATHYPSTGENEGKGD